MNFYSRAKCMLPDKQSRPRLWLIVEYLHVCRLQFIYVMKRIEKRIQTGIFEIDVILNIQNAFQRITKFNNRLIVLKHAIDKSAIRDFEKIETDIFRIRVILEYQYSCFADPDPCIIELYTALMHELYITQSRLLQNASPV